jgi:hypothetical protein
MHDPTELAGCVSRHMPKPQRHPDRARPWRLCCWRPASRLCHLVEDIPEGGDHGPEQANEPAKLPHRKIVQALVRIWDSNSPAPSTGILGPCQAASQQPITKKPPARASCHGQPFDGRNLFKPVPRLSPGAWRPRDMGPRSGRDQPPVATRSSKSFIQRWEPHVNLRRTFAVV